MMINSPTVSEREASTTSWFKEAVGQGDVVWAPRAFKFVSARRPSYQKQNPLVIQSASAAATEANVSKCESFRCSVDKPRQNKCEHGREYAV